MYGRMCGRSRRFFWHWMRADVEAEGLGRFPAAIAQARRPWFCGRSPAKGVPDRSIETTMLPSRGPSQCHADRLTNDAAFWRRVSPKLAHCELPPTRCCPTGLRLVARRRCSQEKPGLQPCQWRRARPQRLPEMADTVWRVASGRNRPASREGERSTPHEEAGADQLRLPCCETVPRTRNRRRTRQQPP